MLIIGASLRSETVRICFSDRVIRFLNEVQAGSRAHLFFDPSGGFPYSGVGAGCVLFQMIAGCTDFAYTSSSRSERAHLVDLWAFGSIRKQGDCTLRMFISG